jgi:hypothetical protein
MAIRKTGGENRGRQLPLRETRAVRRPRRGGPSARIRESFITRLLHGNTRWAIPPSSPKHSHSCLSGSTSQHRRERGAAEMTVGFSTAAKGVRVDLCPFPGIFSPRPACRGRPLPPCPRLTTMRNSCKGNKTQPWIGGLHLVFSPFQMRFGRKRGAPVAELRAGNAAPPPSTGNTANTASRSHPTPPPRMGETAQGFWLPCGRALAAVGKTVEHSTSHEGEGGSASTHPEMETAISPWDSISHSGSRRLSLWLPRRTNDAFAHASTAPRAGQTIPSPAPSLPPHQP